MKILTRKCSTSFFLVLLFIQGFGRSSAQEFLPAPPPDKTLVYRLDEQHKLAPLPFEQGHTPLNTTATAKSTKISYIEFAGEHGPTTLNSNPRLFLFTTQKPGTHLPFLVWLTPRKKARRVTAIAQQGMSGFAISSDEILKPLIRVLAKTGDEVFMEFRPRGSLVPGEYAIIGDDLTRVATFRVTIE